MMKKIVIGILAHVDAGKTTLSESMLYLSGKIRKLGRVDNKDAYLDTYELERKRGITIFSKQAELELGDTSVTLLDTPGHVDFSAEMERTLQVLDYAVLVISGADGVQGHTKTLWRLLSIYKVPVFLFINKMDQNGTDKESLLQELKEQLDDGCIDFTQDEGENFYDELAMCDESLMEQFLESGKVEMEQMKQAVQNRKVFPCFFGSALKLTGVEEFLEGITKYIRYPVYPVEFGAKVFKIARDNQGNRLTYMKITGGSLAVRMALSGTILHTGEEWNEKVNQIRIYSGEKFDSVNEIQAGAVCAVTGLTKTRPGEGLGVEKASAMPILEPVLSYEILLPTGCDPKMMLPKLHQIEEEIPELHIVWDEELQAVQAQIMGEVQIEILKSVISERFGIKVEFGVGKIVYKETIANTVEGVGHFEPLRHYAEVHLLLEPGERGSGLVFAANCSEDELERNWQRLILTHLEEKEHRGVLTGAAITDMKITLTAGRAHKKHTEGGDFREATYRAVRQGLRQAESVLLEPYYAFTLEVPEKMVGRAMTDVEKMQGSCEISEVKENMAVLTGSAPVVTMKNYSSEVTAYTKGQGRMFFSLKGYDVCHNTEEIINAAGYDPEADVFNPTGSVFCAHGAGFLVPWDEVKNYMHVESCLHGGQRRAPEEKAVKMASYVEEEWIDTEEIDHILSKTFYSNSGAKISWRKTRGSHKMDSTPTVVYRKKPVEPEEEYLLVDGYNIIFAWNDLNELAEINVEAARGKLLDVMCNYQGIRKCNVIVVFDAYRVKGHPTEVSDYRNIHVVYTQEAETADNYIEKFVQKHSSNYNVTVATSDGVEQVIIRGAGCALLSARELEEEVKRVNKEAWDFFEAKKEKQKNVILDSLSDEMKEHMKSFLQSEEK